MKQEFYIVQIGEFYVEGYAGEIIQDGNGDIFRIINLNNLDVVRDPFEAAHFSELSAKAIAEEIGGQAKKITVEIED